MGEQTRESHRTKKKNREVTAGCIPTIFSTFRRRYRPPRRLSSSSSENKQMSAAVVVPPLSPKPVSRLVDPPVYPIPMRCDEKGEDLPRSGSERGGVNVVARLMGLEEMPTAVIQAESTVEKRRKLLVELERCERDLDVLKVIIEALQVEAEVKRRASEAASSRDVAVVEEGKKSSICVGGKEKDHTTFSHRVMKEGLPRCHERRATTEGEMGNGKGWMRLMRTREMEECVNEVCDDYVLMERWEWRRIMVVLERGIFGDLIVEVATEMEDLWIARRRCSMLASSSLAQLETCRRRLCF